MRYGLAPCFSGLLEGKFKKFHFMVPHLVKVLRNQSKVQMDLLVRYWSDVFNFVVTEY